jgi:hypothetical protein
MSDDVRKFVGLKLIRMKNYLTLFFLFNFFYSYSQVTFQKIYKNQSYPEFARSYCRMSNDNYVIAGQQNYVGTAFVMKVDPSGNILWRKLYPGIKSFNSIITTSDGGFAIAGTSDSLSPGNLDMCILKTDSAGTFQWCKLFGYGSSNDSPLNLIQLQSGEFILSGQGYDSFNNTAVAYIIKADASGTLVWDKTFMQTGQSNIYVNHVSPTNDGGLIATGQQVINNTYKFLIMKLDPSGLVSWANNYGNNFSGRFSFQTSDGGYISSGFGSSPNISGGLVLLKSDSNGSLQWCKVYSDAISSLDFLVNHDNDYVVATTHQDGIVDSANIYLLKINPLGDTIWTRFYDIDPQLGYRGEGAYNILQSFDEGYIVGSQADDAQTDRTDIYNIKTDANGLAGCNQVYRQIIIETITPSNDPNITLASAVLIDSITVGDLASAIQDSTLCSYDLVEEHHREFRIEVYPNPTSDYINIFTPFSPGELNLEINDLMGRKILHMKISSGTAEKINVSNFSKGVFIICFKGKNESGVSYFCKQ